MDPITVSAAAGGIASSVIGSNSAKKAAKESQKASLLNTLIQTNWERERAQNAHQWEVADLEAAGLNPILSAGGSGAQTSGISPQMPDTSGLNSAGQIMAQGLQNIIPTINQTKQTDANIQSQSTMTEAQSRLINAQATAQILKNPYIPKKEKTEIATKEAQSAKMISEKIGVDIENQYKKDINTSRITKFFAETEQEVSQGRISVDNVKFLEKYGITKDQALKLGADGIRLIGSLIGSGIGVGAALKVKDALLKPKKTGKKIHSAKNTSKNAAHI